MAKDKLIYGIYGGKIYIQMDSLLKKMREMNIPIFDIFANQIELVVLRAEQEKSK